MPLLHTYESKLNILTYAPRRDGYRICLFEPAIHCYVDISVSELIRKKVHVMSTCQRQKDPVMNDIASPE